MKSKYFAFGMIASLLLCGCSIGSSFTTHIHTFDETSWEHDETYHWHKATCGHDAVGAKDEHAFKDTVINPTYDAGGYTLHECIDCGYSYKDGETSQLTHNYESTWSYDKSTHWHGCTDKGYENLKKDETSHNYKDTIINPTYDAGGYTLHECTVCGYSHVDSETLSGKETEARKLGMIPTIDEENKTVTYGLYPQTHVKAVATVSALNKLKTAESNGWYLYNNEYYAKKTAYPCDTCYRFDDGTAIKSNTAYWFKCEPIEWKILTSSDDTYSLVSTVLLDARRYDVSSNNYMNSEIRKWLNNYFLKTAFSLDSSLIQTATVDNSASTTNSSSNEYACADTEDKIYLLSYKDYLNVDYGFSTSAGSTTTRECKTTDYARAKGIRPNTNSSYYYNGCYWTRSPNSRYSDYAWRILSDGTLYSGIDRIDLVYYSNNGVRPALTIKYPLQPAS